MRDRELKIKANQHKQHGLCKPQKTFAYSWIMLLTSQLNLIFFFL